MKRKLLILMMSAVMIPAVAATRYDIHHIGGYVGGGYSGLLNTYGNNLQLDPLKFVGGGGGILGFQYEYHYKQFLLSVGPEFRIFSSRDNLLYDEPYPIGLTKDGYPQTKYYRFSDLQETQAVGQIMLPVMLGGNFDKVYFAAGAKVGYTVLGTYSQKGMLTTSIVDDWAYDEWFEIPSHALQTSAYTSKGKNPFGLDVTLSAEVGMNLDKMLDEDWQKRNEKQARPLRMRVSLFVDYGLPNMNVSTGAPFAVPAEDNITTTSIHQTDWASASRLNSLMVGVKFSALLQMNKPKVQRAPNPRMIAQVVDESTNQPLPGTKVTVYREKNKRKYSKTANKQGYIISRYAPGEYQLTPARAGYLPAEAVAVTHEADLRDTIILKLTPEPVFACYVRDAKTNKYIHATLEFIDNETKKVAYTVQTDTLTGKISQKLKYGQTYTVNISAPDYIYATAQVTNLGAEEHYTLEPIVKGKKVVLRNLFFATNQTTILPESEASLQELYGFLKDNPEVRIRIIGHTDSVGSDADNKKLSDGRAASVKKNIVERGIAADRIETEGRGESEPVASNDTEEGRAQNRRVEFVIL